MSIDWDYFVREEENWDWQHGESLFSHEYSAADREVLIQFPVGTLGDTMGWLPYAVKFKERHGCRSNELHHQSFPCPRPLPPPLPLPLP